MSDAVHANSGDEQGVGGGTAAAVLELEFSHRERPFILAVQPGHSVALRYNGVVRKERVYAGREPLYVWTNVELEWEEHHYIEVRYWPSSGEIKVTVNGDSLAQWQLDGAEARAVEI